MLVRMAKQKQTKKPITPSAGEDAAGDEATAAATSCCGNVRWYCHSGKGLQILVKLNMQLP